MSDRIYTMECHSAIKKKELVIHATTWFNLQGLALSKKKANIKSYILYASNYITLLKGQSSKDEE